MKTYARPLIIVLAAVVLAAAVASLYVHYRLINDPTYTSFCDVNATVSCQSVFQSEYGSVFGVPVAAGGAIWALLVLLLAAGGLQARAADLRSRVGTYIFVLGTAGLAAVFYFAYASFVVLGQACILCMTMYAGVIGVFLVSAGIAGPLGSLPSRLGQDLSAIQRSSTAVTMAMAWVVVSVGLVVFFPRDDVASAAEMAALPVTPVETLTPEQRGELERWLDVQPRADEALPTGDVKVLALKFNDYQCPSCRQAWVLYRDIFAKYETAYPGVFSFQKRDFPLEAECGFGGMHGGACEAAVAVRLAHERNRGREMEDWLFARQATLSRETVKEGLEQVAQVTDFDERYPEVLKAVRADAELGNRLGVSGTPTFFLNGIRLPSLRPAALEVAIEYELRKAGAMANGAGE